VSCRRVKPGLGSTICNTNADITHAHRNPRRTCCHWSRHGTGPSASPAVADASARTQWPHAPRPELAFPTAPCTPIQHTLRRTRITLTVAAVAAVTSRHMERHTQCGAQEEDVVPQEATTVHGGQGTQGHHIVKHMFRLWEGEEDAYLVPILCRW